jgi:ribonuclease HI
VIRGVDNIYVLAHLSLGQHTISEAEYYGVIECLKFLKSVNLTERPITIFSDSQFMVRQLNGEYRVRAENMIPLHTFTKDLLKDFSHCNIVYHSRETELAQQVDKLIHKGTI